MFFPAFVIAASAPSESPIDAFARHALAEWKVTADTFPASPATLSKMVAQLPASVRLAREVTGVNYALTEIDTTDFELTTPRGLIVRIHPVAVTGGADRGLFEAVGHGAFQRDSNIFRGTYAFRFTYTRLSAATSRGDLAVYIDIENRFVRLFALLARRLISNRLAEELNHLLAESKSVMSAAESRLARGPSF